MVRKQFFKKKSILILLVFLILVGSAGGYLFWSHQTSAPSREFHVMEKHILNHVEFFGDRNQYVLLQSSRGVPSSMISLGQNHFVTYERRKEYTGSERPREGWYWHAYVYDIEKKDLKSRKVDLYDLVKKYNSSYYLNNQGTIINQDGKDYQILELRKWKDDSSKFVFLNLESLQIDDQQPILQTFESVNSFRLYDLVSATNFSEEVRNGGGWLNRDFLRSDSKGTMSDSINLSQEYPDIVGKMNEAPEKNYIGFRLGLVSAEDEYQTLRHWFAPIGQDKLEIIGKNSQTGETKTLNTYEEYKEWRRR